MNLTLKIWRQKGAQDKGRMVDYQVKDISEHMSFLEMMDVLNEQLINEGQEPVALITIAVKEYVVLVQCLSMARHMDLAREPPHVNSI